MAINAHIRATSITPSTTGNKTLKARNSSAVNNPLNPAATIFRDMAVVCFSNIGLRNKGARLGANGSRSRKLKGSRRSC